MDFFHYPHEHFVPFSQYHNQLKFCSSLLQYTDDRYYQESSAKKCNQEPLINGILTLFTLLLGAYIARLSLVEGMGAMGMGGSPAPLPSSTKKKLEKKLNKLKNWKIVPVGGSLFSVFAKEMLKYTTFLQNYQVFKCKSANLCNKNCRKLGDFMRKELSPPLPIPT